MKKYILAPLCSGLVIPGLGQVLNNDIRKGLFLLSAVFLLFVVGCVKLAFVIKFLVTHSSSSTNDPGTLLKIVWAEHLPSLWLLAVSFAVIWIYSVVDAFRIAKRLDRRKGDELP